MPELPEVEATCRRIAPKITGRTIRAVEILNPIAVRPQQPAQVAELAAGRKIREVRRRAKNILIDLSGGLTIRLHLGMTGHVRTDPEVFPRTRCRLELSGGRTLALDDSRLLGRLHVYSREELERALGKAGPEPLSREFTPEALAALAGKSRLAAKLFLMDQHRIAGLGNIYAAEALFRARISPRRPMNRISRARLEALHAAIRTVLREAVRSATMAYNRPGKFQEAEGFVRAVYGREGEPCSVCGRNIRRIDQGGRSTYYCPNCQR
jgi:formamidopyrimidine-DNA glycosylase